MRVIVGSFCLLAACALMPIGLLSLAEADVTGLERDDEKGAVLVGEIHIAGNTITRDSVIRSALCVFPNQRLSTADLRLSELNLRLRFHGYFKWWEGDAPSLQVLDSEDPQRRDILVLFMESPDILRWYELPAGEWRFGFPRARFGDQ